MRKKIQRFNDWFAALPLENQKKFVVHIMSAIIGSTLGISFAILTPDDFPLDPLVCIVTGLVGFVFFAKSGYYS